MSDNAPQLPDAPTVGEDGEPMPRFQIAMTMLVESHGVDHRDAALRAMAALRVPSGPFPHSVDHVSGPGPRWICHADVVHANMLSWRQLEPGQ